MGEDRISIHDDRGKLLAERVPLSAISPLRNAAIREMLYCIKRTAIVDVKKLEDSLKTASVGGTMAIGCECKILGRELDLPLVENIGAIADEVKRMIKVEGSDDADVKVLDTSLIVQLPKARVETGAGYSQVYLVSAAAVAYAIIKIFKLGVFDGVDMLKAALLGRYPQTVSPGGAVSALLAFPTKLETMGIAYRSPTINTIVALAGKRTFDAVALASMLEHAAAFESGNAVGPYERFQLLGFGYQGLNGGNMVYELVKEHGRGTLVDIIEAVVKRALEDGVIFVEKELPSGFKVYAPRDVALWNAYAAAGLLAATIQSVGASRAVQSAPSAMLFYNDLLGMQTGLPSVDFGRALGTAITYEWLTHATYGGGAPGVMSGEHVVTRASKGFIIPCACAAVCLDAGTQAYSPEMTSGKFFKIRKVLPEFHRPLERIALAAAQGA